MGPYRHSDRIISIKQVIKEETFNVVSAYALQMGLDDAENKSF